MARRKKEEAFSLEAAEDRMRKAVRNAPHPLPEGTFPRILAMLERDGFPRDMLLDVLDRWLAGGLCVIADAISQDIELTADGLGYF